MDAPLRSLTCRSLDALPHGEHQQLRDMADQFAQAARRGLPPPQRLRGKHLAMLCEQSECPRGAVFAEAASTLGAHVAVIRMSDALCASHGDFDATAALMGLLYDAIGVHNFSAQAAARLESASGKPVFNDVCKDRPDCTGKDEFFFLQAALLKVLV